MADLLRMWNAVRLFHIDERANGPEWEAILAAHAKEALAAHDDSELGAIAKRMLAALDPVDESREGRLLAPRPALRNVSGTVVMSCPDVGAGLLDGSVTNDAIAAQLPAMKRGGVIVDCRGFSNDRNLRFRQREGFEKFVTHVWGPLIKRPVSLGSMERRFWDGYPGDQGPSSPDYVHGTARVSLGAVAPPGGKSAFPTRKAVLIVDSSTPKSADLIASFHGAIDGQVLVDGHVTSDEFTLFPSEHLRITYRSGHFRPPEDRKASRCLARGEDAIAVARRMLASNPTAACPDIPAPASISEMKRDEDTVAVPDLGMRMVALARLWGTFRYFAPYVGLNDSDWDSALETFVPIFGAASDRASYEDAVRRMAALNDDSHVGVRFARTFPLGIYVPAANVRLVDGKLLVSGVIDPAKSPLRAGDEVVRIDGMSIAESRRRHDGLIPAATPQSREDQLSGMLLAGEKGSTARLAIRRGGTLIDVDVPRGVGMWEVDNAPERTLPVVTTLSQDIGYIDLTRLEHDDADAALDKLIDSRVLIIDIRGYPRMGAWPLAPRLAKPGREDAINAIFRRPTYLGPKAPQAQMTTMEQSIRTTDKSRFNGRVILLIDETAISQSEHSVTMFKAATPLTVVGSASTGTNGDITAVRLPGGLVVGFTGHDVRWPDGSQLQRVGITPDIRVVPTPAGLAAGRDEVLEAAIAEANRS